MSSGHCPSFVHRDGAIVITACILARGHVIRPQDVKRTPARVGLHVGGEVRILGENLGKPLAGALLTVWEAGIAWHAGTVVVVLHIGRTVFVVFEGTVLLVPARNGP